MKHRLLAATAISGLAFFAATPAYASCSSNAPAGSTTVTCGLTPTPTDSVGVQANASGSVTVNVEGDSSNTASIQVTNANSAIRLGNNAIVNLKHNSTIDAFNAPTIQFAGAGTVTLDDDTAYLGATNGTAFRANGSGAIAFNNGGNVYGDVNLGTGNATYTLTGAAYQGGTVTAGGTTDSFILGGTVDGTLGNSEIGSTYTGFDTYTVNASGAKWTLDNDGGTSHNWTITAGTLAANGTNVGTAAVASGATLQATGGTFSSVISGAGRVLAATGDTATLNATNTYTGGTVIDGGTLNTSTNTSMGSNTGTNAVTLSNGGTLAYTAAYDSARNIAVGTGGGTINTGSFASTTTGTLSGTGDLTKTGSGTLTMNQNGSTFSGAVNINGGSISVSASNRLGDASSTNVINFDGGTLIYGSAFTQTRAMTLNAGGGTISNNGSVTLASAIGGTGNLTKTGSGALTLSGTSTYSGETRITAGTLTVSSSANMGNDSTTNKIVISGSGTLSMGANTYVMSRDIDMAGNGTITNTSGGSFTLNGKLSGTGNITKSGSGVLYLTQAGTNSGAITLNGSGTISISNANQLGDGTTTNTLTFNSGTLLVTGTTTNARATTLGASGATVNVSTGEVFTQSGVLSSNGNIVKAGAGTLVLSATNINAGGISITGGTLSVAASNNLGDASGTNNLTFNGGTLNATDTFTNARTITMTGTGGINVDATKTVTQSGVISSTGNFTKSGSGALILSGTNTNSGQIYVTAGTLSVGAASNLGNGSSTLHLSNGANLTATGTFSTARAINFASAGTVDVASTHTMTMTGSLIGVGAFTKAGAGALVLTAAGTNSGAIQLNGGTISINASNRLGDASVGNTLTLNGGTLATTATFATARQISMQSTGTIDVANATTFTQNGTIGGVGDLVKTGAGTLVLGGTNSTAGSTQIDAGTISVSATANLGDESYASNELIFNGGSLLYTAAFDQARAITMTGAGTINTGTFDSEISGTLSGTGTLTKSGTGTLALTGANTHTGNLAISAGTLDLGGTANRTYNGVISGSGDLIKSGSGNLIYTGTATLTGNVDISSGKLAVNGSLGTIAALDIASTATLGGTGTVRNVTVNSGGTIAPGNSIGTLNVNGTVDFVTGATYAVEYDNTAADNTIATGNISIGSGVTLSLTGNSGATYSTNTGPFTILQSTGGTISGTFSPVNNTLAFLDADVDYSDNTKVSLSFVRNTTTFDRPTENATQAGTAKAIDSLGTGNTLYDAFVGLSTNQVARAAESASGAGVIGIVPNVTPTFIQPVLTHIAATSGAISAVQTASANTDPSVYTAALFEPAAGGMGATPWIQVIGGTGHTLGKTDTPAQDRGSYGVVAGFDRDLNNAPGRVGIFGGWQFSDFSSHGIGASAEANSYQLGGYIQRAIGHGFTATGGASAMYHDLDTVRHVIIGGTSFSPHGDTTGNTLTAFGELSRPITFSDVKLEGFGNLTVTRNHTNGYSEYDGGTANLVIDDVTKTNPATTLGVRGGTKTGPIKLTGSIGWQHTFGDTDNTAAMRFQTGTTSFTSAGTPIARDAAVISLDARTDIKGGVEAYVGYDGTLAPDAQDHGFKAGVKIKF